MKTFWKCPLPPAAFRPLIRLVKARVIATAFAVAFCSPNLIQAHTQIVWTNVASADFSDTAAWAGAVVPNSPSAVAVITNSVTCNYTASDTYSFDQLWMGIVAQNAGGGINAFNMSGGAL